jgi:hypothetical protein
MEIYAMLIHRFSVFAAAAFSVVVMCFSTTPISAQYNYYQSGAFAFNQFNYPPIGDSTKYRSRKASEPDRQRGSATNPSAPAPTSPRASANSNPLPYHRDKMLSAKIRDEFLEDFSKQMSAAEAAEIRAMVEQADFVQVFAGYARLQGLDSGTMEGLMAFWTGQSWAVANRKALPTPQQYQAIAEQLRTSIAQTPSWRKMNNEQRQSFFERIAYPLIVQKANYQTYLKQGKNDAIARMANATQEGLKKRGLDLQRMQLSNNGFVAS